MARSVRLKAKKGADPMKELSSSKAPAPGLSTEIVNNILTKLLHYEGGAVVLTPDDIRYLIRGIAAYFKGKPALLEINAPVVICGDTHGQLHDVIRILRTCNYPAMSRYLFLGDYVDRGPFSIETVCLHFAYKLRFPDDYHLLRGNHETRQINEVYGFLTEIMSRYNERALWSEFQNAFDSLPVAALINKRLFCMHGGLSPRLNSFDDIRNRKLPFDVPEGDTLWIDLLWADPLDPDTGLSGFVPNMRGASYRFGEDIVAKFCDKFKIDLVVRAHQVVANGYEFFANKKLLTLFSAPNYCGQFGNLAGMMRVSENLTCTLIQIRTKKVESDSIVKPPTKAQSKVSKTPTMFAQPLRPASLSKSKSKSVCKKAIG